MRASFVGERRRELVQELDAVADAYHRELADLSVSVGNQKTHESFRIEKQNNDEIKTKDSENTVSETKIEQQDEDTKREKVAAKKFWKKLE